MRPAISATAPKKSFVREIEDFERKEVKKIEEEIQYGTKELITGILIGIIIGFIISAIFLK
jgi:acid phosphatase family membrane protein YuiD